MADKLLLISDPDFWNLITSMHQNKGGVYRIVAVRDGNRIPINRFLGTDKSGTLYIGKATSFISRVIDLKKAISPDYNGMAHICGRRYKANPKIAEYFPYNILHVELMQSVQPEELEKKMLIEYAREFSEVPPLNAI